MELKISSFKLEVVCFDLGKKCFYFHSCENYTSLRSM